MILQCHSLALLSWLLLWQYVLGDSYLGCYSGLLGLGKSYMYQSRGYCENECSGYKYAALTNGNSCLCSNTLGTLEDDSKCSLSCSGYPSDNCGGDGYYAVYSLNSDASISSSLVSLSATTKTSTSFSLSVANGKTITSAVVVQTTESFSNVYVTYTVSESANATAPAPNKANSSDGLSKGAIAGIVVGAAAAVALGAGAVFFACKQRVKNVENAEIAAALVAHRYNEDKATRRHSDVLPFGEYGTPPEFGHTGDTDSVMLEVVRHEISHSTYNLKIANP